MANDEDGDQGALTGAIIVARMSSEHVSSGRGKAGAPPLTLQFVDMSPGSHAEKKRNQRIVRTTVMKNYRMKKTEKEHVAGKGKRREASISRQAYEHHGLPAERTEEQNWRNAPGQQRTRETHLLGGPIRLLGAGRIGAFQTYLTDVGPYAHELIDHCATWLWPGFLPPKPHGRPQDNISSAWLGELTKRPIVLHAMLFGAIVHMDVLKSPRLSLDNPNRLHHKLQTMRLLKKELEDPGGTPWDDLILTVLTLGHNEVETVENNIKDKRRSPFNSPLTRVQWLDVYGSISHFPVHVSALRSLIDRRGGLEKIELVGLAEVVSFADILGATNTLSRPHWPLLRRCLDLPTTQVSEILRVPIKKLGQGFQDLVGFGINKSAWKVLNAMVDLTITIDCHCRGIKPILDFDQFIKPRNALQHSLLSLLPGNELEHGEVTSISIYESIRHAAMIYAAGVTFPLPPLTGIFPKLASVLKSILESTIIDPSWRKCPTTLLWIMVIGGIAAADSKERKWYVDNLVIVTNMLDMNEWEDVVPELERFLWLDIVCDDGGRSLWTDIIEERYSQLTSQK